MMTDKNYDAQLNNILNQIVRDYDLDLTGIDWQGLPEHKKMQALLRHFQLLAVIAAPPAGDVAAAQQECYAHMVALYDYIVAQLFSGAAGQTLRYQPYDAEDFHVLVFDGLAAMVVEAIGEQIIPFVSQYHQVQLANPRLPLQVAARVLNALFVEYHDADLLEGMVERFEKLRIQDLRLIDLVSMAEAAPHNGHTQSASPTEEETQPAAPAEPAPPVAADRPVPTEPTPAVVAANEALKPIDVILFGRENRRPTAPLPSFFDDDESEDG
jgi:hypothetical protein